MLLIYSLLQWHLKTIKTAWCQILAATKKKSSYKKTPFLLSSFVFIFVTIGQQAVAQWSDNPSVNKAICVATENQIDAQIISDGAGGAIIMWLDPRSTIPNIYAQRVNASGAVQWAADGVAVCTDAGGQYSPKIVSDEAGGAIITWFDRRSGAFNIYAQRINKSGAVQWAVDGVAVCAAADDQFDPSLISDGEGGAIVTWVDYRSFAIYIYDVYIYAQHIDASGAGLWTADGVAVCLEPEYKYFPNIIKDGAGGAIITWQDFRNGSYDIYAQRVDNAGDRKWAADGVPVCIAADDQSRPIIVSDDAGGAIITWEDPRSRAGNPDIYAQRLNALGAIRWSVNGAAVCSEGSYQSNPQIAGDGAGGAIITWCDLRSGSNFDIYMQRVDASGALQWTADGVAVCTAADYQDNPRIINDGAGGAIITWEDGRSRNADLYAQRVDASGAVQWTADGVDVSIAANVQRNAILVSDGAGGAIITWHDSRNGEFITDIYAQKVNADGTLACSSPSVTGEPQARQTVCEDNAAKQLNITATGIALTHQWYADNNNTGYNGTEVIGKTGSSFTPPSTTAGTFYYYAVVTNACGTASSAYATVMVEPSLTWYQDSDNDGYGTAAVIKTECARPAGYVSKAGDCNDKDKTIYPGAPELCDNKDNDCDGKVDEYLTKKKLL